MILVYAGAQADLPHDAEQRLPQWAEGPLRRRVQCHLNALGPRFAVGAAATGSDIIIAEAAMDEGIPVRIVLPFDAETFEKTSIRAHGREWVGRFHALLAATGTPWEGQLDTGDHDAFRRHNQVLLEQALAWAVAAESVQALAIRPPPQGMHSTTDDFAERCTMLAIPLLNVDPLATPAGATQPATARAATSGSTACSVARGTGAVDQR